MNTTLLKIYEIFRDNLNVPSKQQYIPHYGFSQTNALQTFESQFPRLIFENNLEELDTLINKARKDLSELKLSQKSPKTYCTKFLNFLSNVINNPGKSQKTILKELASAYHIDGTQALIELLGGEDKFIEKAIKESYFFDVALVKVRLEEITNLYNQNKPIPARWQGVRKPGVRPQCGYNFCEIDTNGNAKVRSIITEKTGYTISAGNTDFINYKISHIWGKAMDPRFFTNLWNIVLVPAWANDLLDKTNPQKGSLTSKMRNTYMAICFKLYNLKNADLQRIGIQPAIDLSYNNKEVVHATYSYNLISVKQGNNSKGIIDFKTLKI